MLRSSSCKYKKSIAGKIPVEWDAKLLKRVAKVVRGSSPRPAGSPLYFGGDYLPWITVGDVTKKKSIYLHKTKIYLTKEGAKRTRIIEPDTLLLTNSGATLGVPKITKIRAGANDGIAMILFPKGVTNEFLYYVLDAKTRYFRERLAPGIGQPNLNTDIIGDIAIPIPLECEQQKIVQTLCLWDSAIEKSDLLIVAKEERYRWLLSNMIVKSWKTNSWKTVELGMLFDEIQEKVSSKGIPPYSISAGVGFVSQKDKWGRNIAGQQYENYIHLKSGDFAYNKGNSKKYTCGCVYLLREPREICVPNVFICFRKKQELVHPEFYEHYFIGNNHRRELRKYITSGARSDGLLNLSKKDFFKIRVPHPPFETQKYIADVLSTARKEIDLHKKQFEALQKQKRGLMQKLLTGKWRITTKKTELNNDNCGNI